MTSIPPPIVLNIVPPWLATPTVPMQATSTVPASVPASAALGSSPFSFGPSPAALDVECLKRDEILGSLYSKCVGDAFRTYFPEHVGAVLRDVVSFLEVCLSNDVPNDVVRWCRFKNVPVMPELAVAIDVMLARPKEEHHFMYECKRRSALGVLRRLRFEAATRSMIETRSTAFGFLSTLPALARVLALLNLKPDYVYPKRFKIRRWAETRDDPSTTPETLSFLIRHFPRTLPGFVPEQRLAKLLDGRPCLWMCLALIKMPDRERVSSVWTELGDADTKARRAYSRVWNDASYRELTDADMDALVRFSVTGLS